MKIVHCGDSYTYGLGCHDPKTQGYVGVLSNLLEANHINLAKTDCSNYAVFLQMLTANLMKPDLVIVNTTAFDRTEWVKEQYMDDPMMRRYYTASHLDYGDDDSHLSKRPGYEPKIITSGIQEIQRSLDGARLSKFKNEPVLKLKSIINYNREIVDPEIKKTYDVGVIVQAWYKMKLANISCLIIANAEMQEKLKPFIDEANLLMIDFFDLARKMPDRLGTNYCTPEAHRFAANSILAHLRKFEII